MKSKIEQCDITATRDDDKFVNTFQNFLGEVILLNGQFMNVAAELGETLNVTPTQWEALFTVKGKPRTVSQCARRLGMQRQKMQYTINGLVKRGIVELTHNPDHRRSPLIRLTSDGDSLVTELHHRHTELCYRFTGGLNLTIEDLERLRKDLRLLRLHDFNRENESSAISR